VLVFEERGKPEYPEKNLLEQRREPTTNSTHVHVYMYHTGSGNRTWDTLVGGERSHHCAIPTCLDLFWDVTLFFSYGDAILEELFAEYHKPY